jgi:uncharacterized protein (DUF697 family)
VEEAGKHFALAVIGTSGGEVGDMLGFLLGTSPGMSDVSKEVAAVRGYVHPISDTELDEVRSSDLALVISGAPPPADMEGRIFSLDPQNPQQALRNVIGSRLGTDLRLSLARHLPAFRIEVARRVIRDVSMENAAFVVTSALGDVLPSILLPLIGLAEAASDTVVLTANQIRMLFILGAIYGTDVGYRSQWKEISSIIGAAFGWRAIARELVSKIPLGGGLLPKSAIAYAGTTAVGEGLIFYYTTGRHMTRAETAQSFRDAHTSALESVRSLANKLHRQ